MAVYEIQGPDGGTYEIEVPDDYTEDQVMQAAATLFQGPAFSERQQSAEAMPQPTFDPRPLPSASSNATRVGGFQQIGDPELKRMADPTGTGFENWAAGTGKFFYDTARGIGQLAGTVSEEDVAEARRLDAPLMNTTGGQLGAVTGAAATVIGPGALAKAAGAPAAVTSTFMPTTIRGNAALGAGLGFIQPVVEGESRLENAAYGAAGGAAGGYVGQKIAGIGRAQSPRAPAQRGTAIQSARQQGYVLPPSEMNAGVVARTIEGLSGKQQIGQAASTKNQAVTNRLAKRALGLSDDVPLTRETLDAVRAQAGQAYDEVASLGTVKPNLSYFRSLQRLTKDARQAAKDFPDGAKNPILDAVEALKVNQFDARSAVAKVRELRQQAESFGVKGEKQLAGQLRKAASAIEDALEQAARKAGKPELAKQFRDSRQLIAKTYTVQSALNESTGDVSASVLAKLKGRKPLTGELRAIADAGEAFPKATQTLRDPYRAFSPFDLAAGGVGVGSMNPWLVGAMVGRPTARSAMLSGPAQSVLTRQALEGRMLPQIIPNSSRAQTLLRAQERAMPPAMAGLLVTPEEERY